MQMKNKSPTSERRINFVCDENFYKTVQRAAHNNDQNISGFVKSILRVALKIPVVTADQPLPKTFPAVYANQDTGEIIQEVLPPPPPPTREVMLERIREMQERNKKL